MVVHPRPAARPDPGESEPAPPSGNRLSFGRGARRRDTVAMEVSRRELLRSAGVLPAAALSPTAPAAMLRTRLLHPEILAALGRAGHGSKVLIADGNYPFSTTLGPRAELVSLNLMPGVVGCVPVLEALLGAIPVEAAEVMQYATSGPYALSADPPIWAEYRRLLKEAEFEGELQPIERFAYYEAAGAGDVALTIATAETAIYANLLLTIGVVKPG